MTKHKDKAVIALFSEDGKILFQDRKGHSGAGEEWGFFGGGVEKGETPEQALVRELKEELNVDLKAYSFVTNYKVFRLDETYNDVSFFVGPLGDMLDYAVVQEGAGMKLFTIEEARKLKLNNTSIDVLELIQQHLMQLGLVE